MRCPHCGSTDVEPENRDKTNWYCYKCCKFFKSK